MKSNIDLTEHGDFREPNYFETASWLSGLLRDNKRIPWTWGDFKEIHSAEDYGDKSNLFFTGDVDSIRKKKDYLKYEDGKCCDRCGKPINRYHWFTFGIKSVCDKCDNNLQLQYNKNHRNNILKDYSVRIGSNYWVLYLNSRDGREVQLDDNWSTIRRI